MKGIKFGIKFSFKLFPSKSRQNHFATTPRLAVCPQISLDAGAATKKPSGRPTKK